MSHSKGKSCRCGCNCDVLNNYQFSGRARALWDRAKKRDFYKISLMVVGPISQLKHVSTGRTGIMQC